MIIRVTIIIIITIIIFIIVINIIMFGLNMLITFVHDQLHRECLHL